MRSKQATSYKLIERPIYGSSRVGIDARQGVAGNTPLELIGYTAPTSGILTHVLGLKQYEFSNHLGNVLTTVTDIKIPVDVGNDGTIDYYVADITSATDYYPFGSPMDGRAFSSDTYRFGFNGKENDNEVKGAGGQQDYGMRIYDTRLGRFLSVDPLTKKYPMLTPYQFSSNNPIQNIDLDGLEGISYYLTIKIFGIETIIARVYEIDVYVAVSSVADDVNFKPEDVDLIQKQVNAEYPNNTFIDEETGVPVIFKINVIPFDIHEEPIDLKKSLLKMNVDNWYESFKTDFGEPTTTSKFTILTREKMYPTFKYGKKTDPPLAVSSLNSIRMSTSRDNPSHNLAHELFHNFLNNNSDKYQVGNSQEEHDEAGGILKYRELNKDESIKIDIEPLNQQNVNRLSKAVPIVKKEQINK